MYNCEFHIQSIGKPHKASLDCLVEAGVGIDLISQNVNCSCVEILSPKMSVLRPRYVATGKPRCVVAIHYYYVSNIFGGVLDTMKNRCSVTECVNAVVICLLEAVGKRFALFLEVLCLLFLLVDSAKYGNVDLHCGFKYGRPAPKEVKYIGRMMLESLISGYEKFTLYPCFAQPYPDYIHLLYKTLFERFSKMSGGITPFNVPWRNNVMSSALHADAALGHQLVGMLFYAAIFEERASLF